MIPNVRINAIQGAVALRPKTGFVATVLCFLVLAGSYPAWATDNRAPEVPASLMVPDGNKVHFHAYAAGFQVYKWNATSASWVFQAPKAVLFDSEGNIVGIHYAGPTWESNSGSKVVGKRINGVTVDVDAIPWLLLGAASSEGPGIFAKTTYIQRVNTVGGIAPADPGLTDGEVAEVPYTAEYYFYREG